MTTPGIDDGLEVAYNSFVKREPVMLVHLLGGPVLAGVGFAVEHGWIGSHDAGTTQASVTAAVIWAVLTAQGFLLRTKVAPAWKKQTGQELDVDYGTVSFDDVHQEVVDETEPDAGLLPVPVDVPITASSAQNLTGTQNLPAPLTE